MYILMGVCVSKYTAAQLLYNSLDKLSSLKFQTPTPTTTHHSSVMGYTKMSKNWNTVWYNFKDYRVYEKQQLHKLQTTDHNMQSWGWLPMDITTILATQNSFICNKKDAFGD
jgi:hypothetical protein